MKPHKLVIECIQQGGATADTIIGHAGLKDQKELEAQFEILTYLDLYAVADENGIYRLVEEDEYRKIEALVEQQEKGVATKTKLLKDLNKLLNRDPDKVYLDLRSRQMKAYEAYSKFLSKHEKSTERLIQLKVQMNNIKFAIATEELEIFKRNFVEMMGSPDGDIDDFDSLTFAIEQRIDEVEAIDSKEFTPV